MDKRKNGTTDIHKTDDLQRKSENSKGILQCTSQINCPTTVFHEDKTNVHVKLI